MQNSERQAFQNTIKKMTSENEDLKIELNKVKIQKTLLLNQVCKLKELIHETAKTANSL